MWVGSLLGFLSGPWARPLLLLGAVVAWTAYQRHDAAQEVRQQVEAESQAAQLRAVAEAQRIADDAREAADRAEAELSELRRLRDDAVAGGTGCVLTDDQRERLRAIR